jgi:hypothetical protein
MDQQDKQPWVQTNGYVTYLLAGSINVSISLQKLTHMYGSESSNEKATTI